MLKRAFVCLFLPWTVYRRHKLSYSFAFKHFFLDCVIETQGSMKPLCRCIDSPPLPPLLMGVNGFLFTVGKQCFTKRCLASMKSKYTTFLFQFLDLG